MKKLTAFLGALLFSALSAAGPFAISSGTPVPITSTTGTGNVMVLQSSPTINTPTLSIPKLSTQTWANLPAAAGNSGAYTIASDLGTNGSVVTSNGARWRPVGGATNLYKLGAATGNISNSETIICQVQIPANAWQTSDTLRFWFTQTKSGSTDAANANIRIGTAGTIADALVMSATTLGASNLTGGYLYDVKLTSATTALRTGGVIASGAYVGATTGAIPSPVTITSAAANALWASVSISSGGTTNTVSAQDCQIQLITP
jgi:hypothetical protein